MMPRRHALSLGLGAATIASAIGFAACEKTRPEAEVVGYVGRVEALLTTQCARCHSGAQAAGGWHADSWLGAIGCTKEGSVAVGGGDSSPILVALTRPDHAGLLSAADRLLVARWVADGATRAVGGVHARSFGDPRSPSNHAGFLRARAYTPMLDPDDRDACGACHEGAPRRSSITTSAPGAPACATCHTESEGALACSTCHGNGERAYPPRDRCFFPSEPADRAHAAHAAPSSSRFVGLACSTCHPTPRVGELGTVHANGRVEVWFDYALAGRTAQFDPATKSCMATCHAHGGTRPSPSWNEPAMTCNDCHSSPPPNHYRGACTICHHEADATGTALHEPVLHLNGKVDLGDGSGRCGACHGTGDDPWPSTGAHRAHASPTSAKPVACDTCHAVPGSGEAHPVGRGRAAVRLGGLATHGARRASYDETTKTCAGTYCHEGIAAATPAPRWTDGSSVATCTGCHSTPPPPPHVQATTCGGSTCHDGSMSGDVFTPNGRLQHVDGLLTRGIP